MDRTPLEKSRQYPTPDVVLRAFSASGKRHLLITGGRGVGKSTLLSRLTAGQNYPGITTAAVPRCSVVMTDNRTGEHAAVGIYDPALPGAVRKMRPTADGFAVFGTSLLLRCADAPGEIVTIDEIGYLELDCPAYHDALRHLADKKRLMAVVRADVLGQVLDTLIPRSDAFVLDLDCPHGNTGCVIMASGMGKRFGGNKLMADFGGEPMIARALDAAEGIFSRRVVVTRHTDVADYCRRRGATVVLHDLPHRNDTVRLGLEAVGDVASCMFCPGDQPLLRRSTVASLAMASAADTASIYRTAFGDTVGAPVIFPAWTFAELSHLPEGMGGGYVMKRYPQSVKRLFASSCEELADVDTKESLAELLRIFTKTV